jgi:hypothetical protein
VGGGDEHGAGTFDRAVAPQGAELMVLSGRTLAGASARSTGPEASLGGPVASIESMQLSIGNESIHFKARMSL